MLLWHRGHVGPHSPQVMDVGPLTAPDSVTRKLQARLSSLLSQATSGPAFMPVLLSLEILSTRVANLSNLFSRASQVVQCLRIHLPSRRRRSDP